MPWLSIPDEHISNQGKLSSLDNCISSDFIYEKSSHWLLLERVPEEVALLWYEHVRTLHKKHPKNSETEKYPLRCQKYSNMQNLL